MIGTTKAKIVIALILGLISWYSVYTYLVYLSEETTVVILQTDVAELSIIRPSMLKEYRLRKAEKDLLAPTAVSTISEFTEKTCIATVPMIKGSYISSNNLETGQYLDLKKAGIITANGSVNAVYFLKGDIRLADIKLDSSNSLITRGKPGDLIDVIVTLNPENNTPSKSLRILNNVKIFEVKATPPSVTIVVTPQQALDLASYRKNGSIDVSFNPSNFKLK